MNQQQQQQRRVVKPYCKFCEGAGEPIQVYTSHWQFSKPVDGMLTCPKLLAYICKNCNCRGHIESRCNKKQKQEETKKFCRFCFNANNSTYQDHNQFDKDGFVICHALLEIECQKCGGRGHTRKYCDGNNKIKQVPALEVKPKQSMVKPNTSANKFSSLFVEEEEQEQEPAVPVPAVPVPVPAVPVPAREVDLLKIKSMETFPSLLPTNIYNKAPTLSGWAKKAAMPKNELKSEPIVSKVDTEQEKAEYYDTEPEYVSEDEEDEVNNKSYHKFENTSFAWADDCDY